jgi:hypothetical protein
MSKNSKRENTAELVRDSKDLNKPGEELVEVAITLRDVRKSADQLREAARSVSAKPESLRDLIQVQVCMNQYLVGMFEDLEIRIKAIERRQDTAERKAATPKR